MTNDKAKEKRKIWIYAVILFGCAVILLFFTAYSQIKLNKSVNEYKAQLDGEVQEKAGLDLNTSLQLNSQLSNQLKKANTELEDIKSKMSEQSKMYLVAIDKYNSTVKTYDSLINADDLFKKGKITACAITLVENFNKKELSKKARNRYNYLKKKTFGTAAIALYYSGYKKYKTADYKSAIKDFQLSSKISLKEYISDDCYYFIAISAYKTGNSVLAKESINSLLTRFPKSSYLEDAKQLLTKV